MPDCDQSTIADCPYDSHSRLQQSGRVCSLPPLLQKVIAPRMCQLVHRLVWTGDSLCHQLLQCCAVDALTHRRGLNLMNESPTIRPPTQQPEGEQQARGKADTRTMLLRSASNHRILLCSPNTAPPRGPYMALQQVPAAQPAPG
ncbi:Long-chain-fatty-acid--CoA ligase [Giardia duodenalis assemblage B]|uniref:Long-chain-fatty-acid--CoA ligase n=1 Tax=Giardia duodenalis assemblage B TaxID=1394984 RepID=A0A132NNE2_GIAIN|nr:Long-chain-fatty-acid--CoA ligase [Giardia intestinalis assemblage B]